MLGGLSNLRLDTRVAIEPLCRCGSSTDSRVWVLDVVVSPENDGEECLMIWTVEMHLALLNTQQIT